VQNRDEFLLFVGRESVRRFQNVTEWQDVSHDASPRF
jgi:hypothetical protein